MEWGGIRSQYVQIHNLLNGKNRHNRAGKRKGTKETEAAGGSKGRMTVRPRQHGRATPTTGRGENYGQLVVVSGPAIPPFSERCVLELLFGPWVLPWIFPLGLNGPLLQPSLIHLSLTSSFSPITWLDICKSDIKNPEQAKTSVLDLRVQNTRGG